MVQIKTMLLVLLIGVTFQLSPGQGWERNAPFLGRDLIRLEDGTFFIGSSILAAKIAKIDEAGNRLWSYIISPKFNGYGYFSATKSIQTSDGGFILAGYRIFNSNESAIYISRVDENGFLLWRNAYYTDPVSGRDGAMDIIELEDGSFMVIGTNDVYGFSNVDFPEIVLLKVDASGSEIWKKTYGTGPDPHVKGRTVIRHPDGGFILMGFSDNPGLGRYYLVRVDDSGNELWSTFTGPLGEGSDNTARMIPSEDGGYVIAGTSGDEQATSVILTKVNAVGEEIWTKTLIPAAEDSFLGEIKPHPDGGFLLVGRDGAGSHGSKDGFLMKTDNEGHIEWKRNYGGPFDDYLISAEYIPNEGFVMLGMKGFFYPFGGSGVYYSPYLIKTDTSGILFRNQINGNVFEDLNLDCDTLPENGLNGWLIQIEGPQSYFDITDSSGNYSIPLDTGSYNLLVHTVSPYWVPCESEQEVSIHLFDTLRVNIPVQAEVSCPYLIVDISTPLLRRCFESEYTVGYCNAGTIPAEDAYIEVEMDEALIYNSSSVPLTSQDSNIYRFDIGHIEVGECDRFTINVSVDCDSTEIGQTHCVEAHIYPDSLCLPTPNWSGASIELDANCTGDSVIFTIKNVGTAPTTPDLDYLVIEDEVILIQDEFTLDIDASITIGFPANGSTFRLEAEQEPNHPGDNNPSITVEGCGPEGAPVSFGFVTQFTENDGNPFVSIDCQENRGSWDPNDKRAFPKGYGENHFIEANTDIEYHIRFQNTGSDTAFNIVVRDILSENLDLSTVRPGASSHPYEFNIGPDRVLEFTFQNIMLPDSNVNEVASHGFVKFKVSQIPDLEYGEKIFNGAAIYFDFNDPVLTNVTFHTIGRDFILTKVEEHKNSALPARVFPNPFKEQTTFELPEVSPTQELHFYLLDLQGRLLRKITARGNSFEFKRNDLPRGIYLYRIESEGRVINAGKVITQ